MNITQLRTAAMALAFVQMTSVPSLASKLFDVPYRGEAKLKSECSGKGDLFVGSKEGHTCIWEGGDTVTCNKSTKTCKALMVDASKAKKRPKVLQEGGGGGSDDPGGTVKPKVLGGGNPRATPDGDMPDITGGGGLQ